MGRKRKSVRGCIVSAELSVLSLVVVKKGEGEIPGLTDSKRDRRLGPKRASKIRKLFQLGRQDDVRRYVVAYRRKIERPGKKTKYKSPKIQRLITPKVISRRKRELILKRRRVMRGRAEAERYNKLIAAKEKAKREKEELARQRRRTKSRLGSAASTGSKRKPSEKKSTEGKSKKKQKKKQTKQTKGKGKKDKKTDKKKQQPKKQKSQKKPGAKGGK